MTFSKHLIEIENKDFALCLIVDNHKEHIVGHLKYIWKPRVFKHILTHLYLWYRANKMGIPHIDLDEILKPLRHK